ncbi:Septum formation protein Maf [hydrothermal vent metagenome]|uniref:Septum formation protein Maf n=1 Tax=hydrothermal vent metagenome TaxID=652676 RepID=A0A3B0UBB1_9ZZZZ
MPDQQEAVLPSLVLASSSNTRRQMLVQAGFDIVIHKPEINERQIELDAQKRNMALPEIALLLAQKKALAVAMAHPDSLIIAADQILELNGKSLHKPHDLDQARKQLLSLRGKTHHLHCAVALVRRQEVLFQHISTIDLTMRDFSAVELNHVMKCEGTRILDSVGAYRLEGAGVNLFETISGDYFAVLGLPLLPLLGALRQHQSGA